MLPVEGSRVVTISSIGHRFGSINFDDLQSERGYNRLRRLRPGQAGQPAVHLRTQPAAVEAKGAPTIAVAAHPGSSNTELTRNLPGLIRQPVELLWRQIAQDAAGGALPTLRAATDPQVRGGQYYGPDGVGEQRGHPKLVQSNRKSHDEDVARRLWTVSEELTGVTFPV